MNENNPYRSPSQVEGAENDRSDLSNQTGFPWRVFPAAYCWIQGCIGIYGLFNYVLLREHPKIATIALILKTLCFLGACIAFVVAGNEWWKRDWISAIFMSVTAYVLVVCSAMFV